MHKNYHEITAGSKLERAGRLGELFGNRVAHYIDEERNAPDWKSRRREAKALLSCVKRHAPGYFAQLEAYAEGSRLDALDVWTISVEDELGDDEAEKCTTIVSNAGRTILHHEDWSADAAGDLCLVKTICPDLTILELYYYSIPLGGTAVSVSSYGYVQAINSVSHSDWRPGVPKIVLGRCLADVDDLPVALAPLLAMPRSSGYSHIMVGPDGETTCIECSAMQHSVWNPALPFVHTNHYLQPELGSFNTGAAGSTTFKRQRAALALTSPDMDRHAMLEVADSGGLTTADTVLNKNTIARTLIDLEARTASVWLRREANKGWVSYELDFLPHGTGRSA
jgi:hypothetical protein